MNMTVTENTLPRLVIARGTVKHDKDAILTTDGAYQLKAGTILARDTGTKKYVPFVKGGTTSGNGTPKAILGYDKDVLAAGDHSIDALIFCSIYRDKLVILADGNGDNVDQDILDSLSALGIYTESSHDNSKFDNN